MPKVDIRNLDVYSDDRNSSKQKIRKNKHDDDGDYQKKKK
jgi:hypothetical protein